MLNGDSHFKVHFCPGIGDNLCPVNFYLSQLWNTFHPPELVRPALERTLKALELDYVDLYIIEMPTAFKVNRL